MKKRISFILCLLLTFSCSLKESNFISIGLNNCDRISVNDKFTDFESISVIINSRLVELDSIQKNIFFVKLKFSNSAKMGIIQDIKYELMKANIQRVEYFTIEDIHCGF